MQIDQLKRPKHFPNSVTSYALRELTIVWHLYGGRDFSTLPTQPTSTTSSPTPNPKKHKAYTAGDEQVAFHKRGSGSQYGWIRKGGISRDHDVLMEFELNKV